MFWWGRDRQQQKQQRTDRKGNKHVQTQQRNFKCSTSGLCITNQKKRSNFKKQQCQHQKLVSSKQSLLDRLADALHQLGIFDPALHFGSWRLSTDIFFFRGKFTKLWKQCEEDTNGCDDEDSCDDASILLRFDTLDFGHILRQ